MPDLIDEILSLAFTSKDIYNVDLVEINGLSRLLDRNHHQAFLPALLAADLQWCTRFLVTTPDLAATV